MLWQGYTIELERARRRRRTRKINGQPQPAIAHRWLYTYRVLHRPLLFCSLNYNPLLRSVITRNSTPTASSEGTRQSYNSDPHLSIIKDLRSYSLKLRVITNIGILDALRRKYPNYTVTQTLKSTGVLKLIKAS